MAKRVVYFVVGELDGARMARHVAEVLRQREFVVSWYADPAGGAQEWLSSNVPDEITSCPIDEFVVIQPDLLVAVTGFAAVDYQVFLTDCFARLLPGTPVVWIENQLGRASVEAVREVSPHLLFAASDESLEMAKRFRSCVMESLGEPLVRELGKAAWNLPYDSDLVQKTAELVCERMLALLD